MNKIKLCRKGKCAIKNDGTLEELKRVLKYVFPNSSRIPTGDADILTGLFY